MRFALGAAVLVCVVAACQGDGDHATAPGDDAGVSDSAPPDAVSAVPASDAAVDAAVDACPGCPPPKGARRLGLEIDPPSSVTFGAALDQAVGAGVGLLPQTLPWGTLLEPTAPADGGAPVIATPWFTALSDAAVPRGLPVSLSMPLIDTASVQAPSDLAPALAAGTMAFDDPKVVARYEALVDAFFATVDPKLVVAHLVVLNEPDAYLRGKSAAAWTSARSFYDTIRAWMATQHPGVAVTVSVRFSAIVDPSTKADVTSLVAGADTVMTTYYLGANGFGQADGTDLRKDLPTMVAFAGGRPLVLKELGYPTGTNGHSPAGQAAFVTDLFAAWDVAAANVPDVIVSRMYDGARTACESQAAAYPGGAGNEEFIQFLCTLGLVAYDATPKPAWSTFVTAAKARGF